MSSKSSDHSSHTTTDHKVIKEWAEARGGKPAAIKGTEDKKGGGLLRIDFPGGAGEETFDELTWDEFFKTFDERKLAMVYQEHTADGKQSTFNKLVNRDSK